MCGFIGFLHCGAITNVNAVDAATSLPYVPLEGHACTQFPSLADYDKFREQGPHRNDWSWVVPFALFVFCVGV